MVTRSTADSYPARAFFLALLGLSFANLDHSLFTLVLTQVKEHFGWSDAERGWYLCLTFVIAGVIVSQIGVLADRIGRKKTLLISMLLTPVFVVAMIFAPGTVSLLALRTLGFATAGAQSPLTGTLVLEEAPANRRGLWSGVLQMGYPIGWALAALVLVPWVWNSNSEPQAWRQVFWLALLGLPVAAAFALWLREPPVWVEARNNLSGPPPSTAVLFTPRYRRRTLVLFAGQFLHVFAYGSTLLLVAWFQEARGWSFEAASRIIGIAYLVGSAGYVLAAVTGEFWLRRRVVILIWIWLGAAGFAAALWFADTIAATTVAFCVTTFFFFGATAVIFTFTAESFPTEVRATAVSFSGSLGVNLGIAFGPLATSLLVPVVGWQAAFSWAGLVPLVLAGVAYLLADDPVRDPDR